MIHPESFGVIFNLGNQMGTLMVPITLNAEYYNNNTENTQQVQSDQYSNEVRLVNFMLMRKGEEPPVLLSDDLAAVSCLDHHFENSSEMFSEMMQNKEFFNDIVDDLLIDYQAKTN